MAEQGWEWLLLDDATRAFLTARRAERGARIAQEMQAATAAELHAALRESRVETEELAHQVSVLSMMVAAMGEALAEAKVVDPVRVKERFEAKIGRSSAPAPSTKVVRVKECPSCHKNNRGDALVCVKCKKPLD